MGTFWDPWAHFLDFFASREGVKLQRKKGRPKRSPTGPGVSAGSNGEKCVGPKRRASSHQEGPRPGPQTQTRAKTQTRPRPDPEQDQNQNQNQRKEKAMTSKTPFVPRGTVADIYIYIYIMCIDLRGSIQHRVILICVWIHIGSRGKYSGVAGICLALNSLQPFGLLSDGQLDGGSVGWMFSRSVGQLARRSVSRSLGQLVGRQCIVCRDGMVQHH